MCEASGASKGFSGHIVLQFLQWLLGHSSGMACGIATPQSQSNICRGHQSCNIWIHQKAANCAKQTLRELSHGNSCIAYEVCVEEGQLRAELGRAEEEARTTANDKQRLEAQLRQEQAAGRVRVDKLQEDHGHSDGVADNIPILSCRRLPYCIKVPERYSPMKANLRQSRKLPTERRDSHAVASTREGLQIVSDSIVPSTKLIEVCGLHQVPGRELSELLSACYLYIIYIYVCATANSLICPH